MELRVRHTLALEYDAPARSAYLEARLSVGAGEQSVRNAHLDVDPQPWSTTYLDYWGTRVTAFELLQAHDGVTVTATATVRTAASASPTPTLAWDDLAAPALLDEMAEFLVVGASLPPADLALRADKLVAEGARPGELALEVCRGAEVTEALAALRGVGMPCRYVAGYLAGRTAPHGWLEWWDGTWQGFDPAVDAAPGEQHVIRAVGRSPEDVRALHGVVTGAQLVARTDVVEVTSAATPAA